MKTKSLFLGLTISIFLTVFTQAQMLEKNVQNNFINNNSLGNKCLNNKSYYETKNNEKGDIEIIKVFEIEVLEQGDFLMNMWFMGIEPEKGFIKYTISVDGEKAGKIKVDKTGWQNAGVFDNDEKKRKKFILSPGIHLIAISCKAPEVPEVEFIRIGLDEEEANISEEEYNLYIEELSNMQLPDNYLELLNDTTNNDNKLADLNDFNYRYQLDHYFTYTYYKKFWFRAGDYVEFETKHPSSGTCHPVLQLFNQENPLYKDSWVDARYNPGYLAKIKCYIQYTGYYYLMIRSYYQGLYGTVDLYKNGRLYFSNCPVGGNAVRCEIESDEKLNYFTARLSKGSDTRIWLEGQMSFPGPIRAWNGDYYNSNSEFGWGNASRVDQVFPDGIDIRSAIVSSSYSYPGSPVPDFPKVQPAPNSGYCDLYMGVGGNGDAYDYNKMFPNLDDYSDVK